MSTRVADSVLPMKPAKPQVQVKPPAPALKAKPSKPPVPAEPPSVPKAPKTPSSLRPTPPAKVPQVPKAVGGDEQAGFHYISYSSSKLAGDAKDDAQKLRDKASSLLMAIAKSEFPDALLTTSQILDIAKALNAKLRKVASLSPELSKLLDAKLARVAELNEGPRVSLRMFAYGFEDGRPRPPRMAKPKVTPQAHRIYKEYIMDLAEDILIDKYGTDRGHKTWEYLVGQSNPNAIFPVCQQIMDEKAQMFFDLGEIPPHDYWSPQASYFTVWQRWMKMLQAAKAKGQAVPVAS